jgi:hypothetical protein
LGKEYRSFSSSLCTSSATLCGKTQSHTNTV